MLVTERKPISDMMREGMIEGYTQCYDLTQDEAMQGVALPFCLDDHTDALYPPAFRAYRARWMDLAAAAVRDAVGGDEAQPACPLLSYHAWCEWARELQEDAILRAMFGYPPSKREASLRARLLLPAEQPLAACLPDLAAESEARQGLIAAYEDCRTLTDAYPFDTQGLGAAICARLKDVFPPEFLLYSARYGMYVLMSGDRRPTPEVMGYDAWRQAVIKLNQEAKRSAEQQRAASRRYRTLRRQLLLDPDEPDPTPFGQNDETGIQS